MCLLQLIYFSKSDRSTSKLPCNCCTVDMIMQAHRFRKVSPQTPSGSLRFEKARIDGGLSSMVYICPMDTDFFRKIDSALPRGVLTLSSENENIVLPHPPNLKTRTLW